MDHINAISFYINKKIDKIINIPSARTVLMILTFIIMNAKETSKNEFIVLVKILSEF